MKRRRSSSKNYKVDKNYKGEKRCEKSHQKEELKTEVIKLKFLKERLKKSKSKKRLAMRTAKHISDMWNEAKKKMKSSLKKKMRTRKKKMEKP